LEDDLRAAAVSNPSVLGQLQALASSQEDRWSVSGHLSTLWLAIR